MNCSAQTVCWTTACVLLALAPARAEPLYSTSFAAGKWDSNQWTVVKSARWDYRGGWIQREDCVENETPPGFDAKKLADSIETYSSMLWNRKLSGDVSVSATMEFLDRFAPIVVLAAEPGKDANGRPEYRDHFEICVYNEGVNVWRHVYRDGKQSWKKAAYGKFALKPNTRYKLSVKVKGKEMSVAIDGHELGYMEDSIPKEFYAGITGCEGINRFYDFAVDGR